MPERLTTDLTFYEFFAGGGMARLGLGARWRCLFANDIDENKAACYRSNFPAGELRVTDIATVTVDDLPGSADMAWASFPCQDLSLAGNGAGLSGERSGTFWPFWRLVRDLAKRDRAPRVVVLENVCGALRSHRGKDFATICEALAASRYRFGAVVLDAVAFLPQSRPRLFIIAHRKDLPLPSGLTASTPDLRWTPPALLEGHSKLSQVPSSQWVWWTLPAARAKPRLFSALIEDAPHDVAWHSPEETAYLLSLMSDLNRAKVETQKALSRRSDQPIVGAIYKRTRTDQTGRKCQRAEVRFDDIAGCLRTPVGGSSRQTIIVIQRAHVSSRLLSSREAARLMGLPESYVLPKRYNDAYHVIGDGLAVPVVRHLAEHLLEPLLSSRTSAKAA